MIYERPTILVLPRLKVSIRIVSDTQFIPDNYALDGIGLDAICVHPDWLGLD